LDPIIDAHGHLGDILYPGGGELIDRVGVVKEEIFDPTSRSEALLHRDPLRIGRFTYRLFARQATLAERARNATATLENFGRSLDETGVSHAVCLPIPPNVGFQDLLRASQKDPRIVAFTGVDYTPDDDGQLRDPSPQLEADVRDGARGLKLHPIIQKVPLTSEATRAAVESFAGYGLPVLFHCGISSYYLDAEGVNEEPSYGSIEHAERLARDFPGVRFIAGHAGLFAVREVMARLAPLPNVSVDTSFQNARHVRRLIDAFGSERVLFASDWPYGNRPPALAIVRKVCGRDAGLERRLLFENAAELMGLRL